VHVQASLNPVNLRPQTYRVREFSARKRGTLHALRASCKIGWHLRSGRHTCSRRHMDPCRSSHHHLAHKFPRKTRVPPPQLWNTLSANHLPRIPTHLLTKGACRSNLLTAIVAVSEYDESHPNLPLLDRFKVAMSDLPVYMLFPAESHEGVTYTGNKKEADDMVKFLEGQGIHMVRVLVLAYRVFGFCGVPAHTHAYMYMYA
jgi:hypothetical protein